MRPSRERRAIAVSLRCYPARWQTRHGDEAALLTTALLEDGVAWWSIAMNFLGGATRERLTRRPSFRAGAALVAVAVGVAAVPLALVTSFTPASATSTNVVIVITNPHHAKRQLESAFAAHHFNVIVTERVAPTGLVGSILSISTGRASGERADVISVLHGPCVSGASDCVVGVVLPRDFAGTARVSVGRAALAVNRRGR